jgi:hypothetical protein
VAGLPIEMGGRYGREKRQPARKVILPEGDGTRYPVT